MRHKEVSAAVRIRAYKRDRFQCTYCGIPGTDAELEVDHIIPMARGGSNHMSNLTTACRACNSKKSDGHYVPPKTHQPKAEVVETPATLPNGMTGLFLHTFKDDGRIHYQGRIVDVVGQVAMVQLYSWVFGDPTNIEAIPLDTICSNKVRLYRSHADWIEAGDRGTRRS